MLYICYINACLLDIIILNPKKSSLFLVSKSRSMFIDGLTIGGDNISWCEKLKYLGVSFYV